MKLTVNHEQVDATRMEVVSSDEKTSEYLLKNGTVIRVRTVVMDISRLDNRQDADGKPVYYVSTQLVIRAEEGAT